MILYLIISVIYIILLIVLYFFFCESFAFGLMCIALFHFIFTISKFITYINTIKIKKYLIDNKLEKSLGKIFFWNEKNYFLTDKYMIIIRQTKVTHFGYNEIKTLEKQTVIKEGRGFSASEYLIITLKNSLKYRILIWSTSMVNEEMKDITEFLLEKNSNIKVLNK